MEAGNSNGNSYISHYCATNFTKCFLAQNESLAITQVLARLFLYYLVRQKAKLCFKQSSMCHVILLCLADFLPNLSVCIAEQILFFFFNGHFH